MKKHVLTIAMLAVAMLATAQYSPNTKWPYLFENFENGVLYRDKEHSEEAMFNIHFMGNTLHYVSPTDEKIYTAKYNRMDSIVTSHGTFVQGIDGQMMQVVAKSGENMVLKLEYADFDMLFETGGAYGSSSSTSATRKLSSLDLGGLNNPKLGLLLQEKNDGDDLRIRTRYYIRVGGNDVEANKGDIEDFLGEEKKASWNQFLKANKIKWKKVESLAKVLEYFK